MRSPEPRFDACNLLMLSWEMGSGKQIAGYSFIYGLRFCGWDGGLNRLIIVTTIRDDIGTTEGVHFPEPA